MESEPAGRVVVTSVAVLLRPPPEIRVALPIAVEPSMKVTEPVGAAYPLETVAVRVTDCPLLAGLTDEATAVVVLAGVTIWLTTTEVDPPKSVVAA
jgi:hypothetical protein